MNDEERRFIREEVGRQVGEFWKVWMSEAHSYRTFEDVYRLAIEKWSSQHP